MLEFFCLIHRRPPSTTLFPYTTLFRSDRDPLRVDREVTRQEVEREPERSSGSRGLIDDQHEPIETEEFSKPLPLAARERVPGADRDPVDRSMPPQGQVGR